MNQLKIFTLFPTLGRLIFIITLSGLLGPDKATAAALYALGNGTFEITIADSGAARSSPELAFGAGVEFHWFNDAASGGIKFALEYAQRKIVYGSTESTYSATYFPLFYQFSGKGEIGLNLGAFAALGLGDIEENGTDRSYDNKGRSELNYGALFGARYVGELLLFEIRYLLGLNNLATSGSDSWISHNEYRLIIGFVF